MYPYASFENAFEKLKLNVSHKAKVAVQTAKFVRNMRVELMCVKDNEFKFFDLTDPETYQKNRYNRGNFRAISVKFDLPGGKTDVRAYLNALSGIYEAVYRLIYYAYDIHLQTLSIYLSNFISSMDENRYSAAMCRQWKRFGYIIPKYDNALIEVIKNTFEKTLTPADLHRAYNDKNLQRRTIDLDMFKHGMSRSMVDSIDVVELISPGNEPEAVFIIKPDKEVSLDEVILENIADDMKASDVRLNVDGTLVIRSMAGYNILKLLNRKYVNNCLKIKTRISATILDWILKNLAFKVIDLSDAKTSQEIKIVLSDEQIRYNQTQVIPGENIKVS